MYRGLFVVVAIAVFQITGSVLASAQGGPKPVQCKAKVVDGLDLKQVTGTGREAYFESRVNCDVGYHGTGGGFRMEFASEDVHGNWSPRGSFPISTNGDYESWGCMYKYVGSAPVPTQAPPTLWCFAVCCPDKAGQGN